LREHLTDVAKCLNHFRSGYDYKFIDDVEAFATKYKAKLAKEKEEGDKPFSPFNTRLSDFGGPPDFSEMTAPRIENGLLIFYLEDDFTCECV
jgi:hypothetical protein